MALSKENMRYEANGSQILAFAVHQLRTGLLYPLIANAFWKNGL
jgi:hypothetical protein